MAKREGAQRPVEGRHHEKPARLHGRRAGAHEGASRPPHAPPPPWRAPRRRSRPAPPRLDRLVAVIDRNPGPLRMVLAPRAMFVGAGSSPVTRAPSRASGSESTPPPQPTSRMARPSSERTALRVAPEPAAGRVADIGEAHRVELVQGPHRALRVPPGLGDPFEPRHFGGVDGRVGHGRSLPAMARTPRRPCRSDDRAARPEAGAKAALTGPAPAFMYTRRFALRSPSRPLRSQPCLVSS